MKKSAIVGTAGHIDHGKTALVKALTGVDTDRLPEEKARGITIDLGFAHCDFDGIAVSFIDVPGHEKFVKNMLAGVGGIDLVMLVVGANESVMPQTREHFEICKLLDVRSGVVVVTKQDLVDEETIQVVQQEIIELVQGSFLEKAPIVTISAKTGAGIESLRRILQNTLRNIQQRFSQGVFRLPVDRVFTLKGHGTVVTGTLISGAVRKDHPALIMPSGIHTRIRSVHAHNESVESAFAGQRTALNLQGIERDQVIRGDVITEPDVLLPSSLLDVKITLLPGSRPLSQNAIVRLHHHTNDIATRITLMGRTSLNPGESVFAQLRLQRPILAVAGDRFILRRHSPLMTIGGGIILDHLPAKRVSSRDQVAIERMGTLENASPQIRLATVLTQRGNSGAGETYLKARMGLQAKDILALGSTDTVFLKHNPLLAISKRAYEDVLQKIRKQVADFHTGQPLLAGIPKEELKNKLKPISDDMFAAILEQAVVEKVVQVQKDAVLSFGRKIAMTASEEMLAKNVQDALLRCGLEFPGFASLASDLKNSVENLKKIVYLLVRQQQLVKISDDYFLHAESWNKLKESVRALKTTQRTFSVPDFKTIFGVSRKFAIPLLEQLDREGVTRRTGNERIIV